MLSSASPSKYLASRTNSSEYFSELLSDEHFLSSPASDLRSSNTADALSRIGLSVSFSWISMNFFARIVIMSSIFGSDGGL